jgi:predicted glutamine amidotransferase
MLWSGWTSNRHGAGFAYVDKKEGKVVIRKGFMLYNDFQKAYNEACEANPDTPFIVHMRIRTSGATNGNNTHPFAIKGGAMIHNGSFFTPGGKYVGPKDDEKSDTRVFAENLFNILTYEDVVAAERDILNAVGSYNKMVFLYDDGRSHIMNERDGQWIDGIWFSNGSCRVYNTKPGPTSGHTDLTPTNRNLS